MFMAVRTEWKGTATDLLGALKMEIGEDKAKLKEWPATPRALSGRVRRQTATLRRVGIDIAFEKAPDHTRNRLIKLCCQKSGGNLRPNRPNRPNSHDFSGIASDGRADGPSDKPQPTVRADGADDAADGSPDGPSDANPLKNKASDGVDGVDANFPTQTGKAPGPERADTEPDGTPEPAPDSGTPNFAKVLDRPFDWSPFDADRRSRQ
jgi:hypothetical protein